LHASSMDENNVTEWEFCVALLLSAIVPS